ncbi:hypothetical protein DFH28DRAFT_980971 [Melampsora americana]|nr:hypothetical protein DFH28DRAFT_980971 [Melampsora americana]
MLFYKLVLLPLLAGTISAQPILGDEATTGHIVQRRNETEDTPPAVENRIDPSCLNDINSSDCG